MDSIEKLLFPEAGVLVETDEGIKTVIVDVELDPLELTFNNDDAVKISTSGYEYVYLSEDNLLEMIELLNQVKTSKNK